MFLQGLCFLVQVTCDACVPKSLRCEFQSAAAAFAASRVKSGSLNPAGPSLTRHHHAPNASSPIPTMPDSDIRLLALDGGGVRGLSSLMILRSLMAAVDPDNPPKPCDYFDMIGGTSTGGLIAVMLGRLHMSVDDCIAAYISLSNDVFQKKSRRMKINGKLQGRFDSTALERAIKQILKDSKHDENVLLKDTSSTCKVFVCATSKQTNDAVCLTSYRTPRSIDLLNTAKVWQACRATSAATTFFDPIAIGIPPEEFVDGALGMNNPIFALWNQA
ncbi:cGAMP-activated phospholipase [Microdochium nivale]|nr:cGAMP-activated phospholipase [Microdochium nivale]